MAVVELTNINFEEVVNNSKYLIVDFWAPWCGPCRAFAPVLEELSNELTNCTFAKINVENYPEQAAKYQVFAIPTLIFFKDGEPIDRMVGVQTKENLRKRIEKLMT